MSKSQILKKPGPPSCRLARRRLLTRLGWLQELELNQNAADIGPPTLLPIHFFLFGFKITHGKNSHPVKLLLADARRTRRLSLRCSCSGTGHRYHIGTLAFPHPAHPAHPTTPPFSYKTTRSERTQASQHEEGKDTLTLPSTPRSAVGFQ